MLKKVNRLKKRYQFNYVYKNGEHFSGKAMILYVTSSKTKAIKVGLAVGKKIGHATKRNFVKRKLREIIYKEIPFLKQQYNIIVVAKENIKDFSFEELSKEFHSLILKAGLLNEKSF